MRGHYVYERSLDQAIKEIQELRDEVAQNLFIPKRFRSKPFTEKLRQNYVAYLDKELIQLREKSKFKKGNHHGKH